MDPSIRRSLWGAFAALSALIILGLGLSLSVLEIERAQESHVVRTVQPLLDAVQDMDTATTQLLAASRGFTLTKETQFLEQYSSAIANFNKALERANRVAVDPELLRYVARYRGEFAQLNAVTNRQIRQTNENDSKAATGSMLEAARIRSSNPDYAGIVQQALTMSQAAEIERINSLRQTLTLSLVILSVLLIAFFGYTMLRIERSLIASINRQVRRTEAMVGGMADGVMLVDG